MLYLKSCRETTVSPTSRNGPQAVPKSSESSYTETFSLQKFKRGAILARLLGRAAPIHAPGLLSLNIFKDRGLRATNLHSKFYFMHAIALNWYSLFLFDRLEIEKSADVPVCGFFIWKWGMNDGGILKSCGAVRYFSGAPSLLLYSIYHRAAAMSMHANES